MTMETESQNMDFEELFENLKAASKNGKFLSFDRRFDQFLS